MGTIPLAQLAIFEAAMTIYGRDFAEVQRCVPWIDTKGVVGYYYKQFKRSKNYERWQKQHKLKQLAAEEVSAEAAVHGVEKPWLSDFWDEICGRCREMGSLICCDTCNLAWHEACLVASERPQEHQQQDDSDPAAIDVNTLWSCPDCVKSGDVITNEGKHRAAAMVRRESAGVGAGVGAGAGAAQAGKAPGKSSTNTSTDKNGNTSGIRSRGKRNIRDGQGKGEEEWIEETAVRWQGKNGGKRKEKGGGKEGEQKSGEKKKERGNVLGGRRRVKALWTELWPLLHEAGWRSR
jgi:hypothetical protein